MRKFIFTVLLTIIATTAFSQPAIVFPGASGGSSGNDIDFSEITTTLDSILNILGDSFAPAMSDIRAALVTMGISDAQDQSVEDLYLAVLNIEAEPSTKEAIRQSIINRDVFVSESAHIASYPEYIAAIATPTMTMFDDFVMIPSVEAGEDLVATMPVILKGDVVTAGNPIKTSAIDSNPYSYSNDLEFSANGEFLVIAEQNTNGFTSYKWNGAEDRYEKTALRDVRQPGYPKCAAMTADGKRLAIGSDSSPYLTIYNWIEDNNRYEKATDQPIGVTLPGTLTYAAKMSSDGTFLIVTSYQDPKLAIFKWNEKVNTYVYLQTFIGLGTPYDAAMSADGQKFVLCSTTAAHNYMSCFKYNKDTQLFDRIENPDVSPGSYGRSCAMTADGSRLTFGCNSSPYLHCYIWNEDNNRYELSVSPDVDLSSNYPIAMDITSDGKLMAVCHTPDPYDFTNYIWNEFNNRYEKYIPSPDTRVANIGRGIALSADGKRFAVGVNTAPYIETYHVETVTYENFKLFNLQSPSFLIPVDAWALGFVEESVQEAATANFTAFWWRHYINE
jgi:6-phosphogluconolactonase (cycloisomerase 2 family)